MRKSHSGFTLLELMIVVAILGIVASIAYPAYQEQVRRSGRADAKVALNDAAQRMQRCFTSYGTYKPVAPATCEIVTSVTAAAGLKSPEGNYAVRLANADHTATTFILRATPIAGTQQTKDTDCQTFTLSQTGARTALNASNATSTDKCW